MVNSRRLKDKGRRVSGFRCIASREKTVAYAVTAYSKTENFIKHFKVFDARKRAHPLFETIAPSIGRIIFTGLHTPHPCRTFGMSFVRRLQRKGRKKRIESCCLGIIKFRLSYVYVYDIVVFFSF